MRRMLLLSVALLTCFAAVAQVPVGISGRVTEKATGQPLVGASIAVQETGRGTSTGADGSYQLQVVAGQTLVISYLGLQTQTIVVNASQTTINVTMETDATLIDDVVVIGYGTVRKRDLSGSVGQVKSDDLLNANPATSINNALQGKLAGVVVNQNDGAPGAGVSITVRGTNSFTTSSQPLYIVDGVPFDVAAMPSSGANANTNQTANALALINPNTIESIEVLKDASATAIYGSRGANGVIMITTKRGTEGGDVIEFTSNVSISTVAKQLEVLSAYDYANYINEQYSNDVTYLGAQFTDFPYRGEWSYTYQGQTINPASGRYNPSPNDYLTPRTVYDSYGNSFEIADTNWQDEIFRNGFSQEYNIMVRGGDAKGWHNFSGNYVNQSGTIIGSGYERFGVSMNIGRKIHDWIEMGMVANYTHSKTDFTKSNAYDYSIIRSALIFPSNNPADMSPEQSDELGWLAANPALYVRTAKDQLLSNNIFTSGYINLMFTDWLSLRQNIGITSNQNERGTYYGRYTQEGRSPKNGVAGLANNRWQGVTSESILTFNKVINEIHSLNVVAGFTYEYGEYFSSSMTANNFASDEVYWYDMKSGLNYQQPISEPIIYTDLYSFLARANYVLADKYIFTASFRRDGSSKFQPGSQYANFWSGAIAWRISEEEFIKNLNIFDNLKLRASFGQTGSQGIASYATRPALGTSNYPFAGQMHIGYAEPSWSAVNRNLKWETTDQFNVGLDFGFFKNRVNFTIDLYHKNTRDLLQRKTLPPSTGFQTIMINGGNVVNKGLEITGSFAIFAEGDFKWSVDANISFNKNSIHGLESDMFATRLWFDADEAFIYRNGLPMGTIYGYVEDGFYDNAAEVRANPNYASASNAVVQAQIGEIKYRDFDGDGNPDRQIIGNINPDFVYGLTSNFQYKNWSLSFFLQGTQGNDIFNGNLMDIEMANVGNITKDAYEHRWTPENRDNARFPRATAGYGRSWLLSDRYVEDGSYLRLKNLSIGYTFNNLKIKGLSAINIYASAQNLFTWTKYSWYDPDVNTFAGDSSRRGVDMYSYPSARTFSLGVKITF